MRRYARQRSRENTLGNGGTRIGQRRLRTERILVATPPRKGAREMSLVKRGKTWHTHFFVDGQRVRQSLETSDWREAQAKEKELIAQATQGNVAASHQGFAKLPFAQAATSYFNGRKLELGESSQKKERQLLVKPREFFQRKCVSKITPEDVLKFREWRSE